MDTYDTLKQMAQSAPHEPGVYVWRNDENRIIYVGKAKVLRNRLMSYFSGNKDAKTAALLHNAARIETIITAHEYDALLLENTLIKQHYPQYNVALKDDSGYPFIKISAEAFPLLVKTRRRLDDGAFYYGPFPDAGAVKTMLSLIAQFFPLRTCRRFHKRRNPCLYYHLNRCPAPCCGKITEEAYAALLEPVRRLLSGDHAALKADLTEKMRSLSANLDFEKAALVRDSIKALEMLATESSVVDGDPESRDYIACAGEGVLTTFAVFSVRGGALCAHELYRSQSAADDAESLETFMMMYYSQERQAPAAIYCEGDFPTLQRWFSEHCAPHPLVLRPDLQRHRAILAMAAQNAREDLRKRLKERGAGPALDELAALLHVPVRPERIEGFDIAQLNGKHPVASLVSFKHGVPDKKNYRVFKLRTVVGIIDDYAALREAVRRRYARLLREEAPLPDLILVDGGAGQVNSAQRVLKELGIDCALVGLAKRDEELWLPHQARPLKLSRRSEALKVLQYVRDESHRVATSFNQKLRAKDLCFSLLEANPGIGPARAAALLKAYPSLHALVQASPALLSKTAGISTEQAQTVLASVAEALKHREQYPESSSDSAAMLAAEALNLQDQLQSYKDEERLNRA